MVERALKAARCEAASSTRRSAARCGRGYDRDFRELAPAAETGSRRRPRPLAAVRMVGRLLCRPVGLELDLNGVVKGQTVDEAVDLLSGDGFVAAAATTRGAATSTSRSRRRLGSGHRGGLATSGTTKRRWLRAGVWQHHSDRSRSGGPRIRRGRGDRERGHLSQADVAAKAAFLLGQTGRPGSTARPCRPVPAEDGRRF
jgi:hypothetical protein